MAGLSGRPRGSGAVRAGGGACRANPKRKRIPPTSRVRFSLSYSAEDLAALDAALLVVEQKLAGLVSLTSAEVRGLAKMGEKSEVLCRSVLQVLEQYPQVVTPALGLPAANGEAGWRGLRPAFSWVRGRKPGGAGGGRSPAGQ